MKKTAVKVSLILLLSAGSFSSFAQCAMCRASAESNLDSKKNKVGAGLNNGILYLMSIPYIVGGIGLFVYLKKKDRIRDFFSGNI